MSSKEELEKLFPLFIQPPRGPFVSLVERIHKTLVDKYVETHEIFCKRILEQGHWPSELLLGSTSDGQRSEFKCRGCGLQAAHVTQFNAELMSVRFWLEGHALTNRCPAAPRPKG
jgi:hypothetical protein